MSSSRPRRPSVSIYDYPEHLNPFNDDTTSSQPQVHHEGKSSKESRHKFWTFGRSRKKRSNSFSIKSTWNGLFGKRKENPESVEKRSTITTVSTTYKREPCDRPTAPLRLSKDQQEFDEALGTLTRRRKYTFDNTSRYSSNLTVNGDPARISDGNPQNTTTSIMSVNLTPKPPARRFGQVSPRPTDKIPPLNFEDKQNGSVNCHDKSEEIPIPPMRRFGNRSSQRLSGTTLEEDSTNRSGNISLRDENENVPEDYVFKRFNQDAVRRSNLSINSCISVTSTTSTYGRKKRRAPQPPKQKEQLDTPLEGNCQSAAEANKIEPISETSKLELRITEPIDIARVTENIDEMKKPCEELNETSLRKEEKQAELYLKTTKDTPSDNVTKNTGRNEICDISKNCESEEKKEKKDLSEEKILESDGKSEKSESESKVNENSNIIIVKDTVEKDSVDIEYRRTSQEKIEIIKDIDEESDEVCLRKKGSSSTLSRSDSFSVKEEIEKIERQIKALESKNASNEQEDIDDVCSDDPITSTRLSIQANRRHFFENMVDGPSGPVKLEFKKLPREQNDIHVVRLTDSPIPIAASRDPVKVIELHISEPIKHKPELLDEVNPIPKPRRHSALSLRDTSEFKSKDENKNLKDDDNRGKSF